MNLNGSQPKGLAKGNSFAVAGRLAIVWLASAHFLAAKETDFVSPVVFPGDGGFVMKVGNREFRSCSYFSRPGGGWDQLGTGAPAPGNLISWKAQQIRQTKDTWQGSVTTEKFRLHRVIRLSGQRIEVEDALANISNADLGWMIRNEVALPPDASEVGLILLEEKP